MFFAAEVFNQPINTREIEKNGTLVTVWNVSNVTKMNSMFQYTNSFNQDIGNWNVSKVENMNRMFESSAITNKIIPESQSTVRMVRVLDSKININKF